MFRKAKVIKKMGICNGWGRVCANFSKLLITFQLYTLYIRKKMSIFAKLKK